MKRKLLSLGIFLLFCSSMIVVSSPPIRTSTILRAKCVGCSDCVRACPVHAIALDRGKAVVDPAKCIGCHMCVIICSYGAPR